MTRPAVAPLLDDAHRRQGTGRRRRGHLFFTEVAAGAGDELTTLLFSSGTSCNGPGGGDVDTRSLSRLELESAAVYTFNGSHQWLGASCWRRPAGRRALLVPYSDETGLCYLSARRAAFSVPRACSDGTRRETTLARAGTRSFQVEARRPLLLAR
ncbi:hypothetical protein MTO96_014092 [Rhipicephalus appendiculatus]